MFRYSCHDLVYYWSSNLDVGSILILLYILVYAFFVSVISLTILILHLLFSYERRMVNAKLCQLLHTLVSALILLKVDGLFVNITYLQSAVAKGAGEMNKNVLSLFQFFYFWWYISLVDCNFFWHDYVIIFTVCLDGSPPAYHMDKGFGTGINNWLVHIEVWKSYYDNLILIWLLWRRILHLYTVLLMKR